MLQSYLFFVFMLLFECSFFLNELYQKGASVNSVDYYIQSGKSEGKVEQPFVERQVQQPAEIGSLLSATECHLFSVDRAERAFPPDMPVHEHYG